MKTISRTINTRVYSVLVYDEATGETIEEEYVAYADEKIVDLIPQGKIYIKK